MIERACRQRDRSFAIATVLQNVLERMTAAQRVQISVIQRLVTENASHEPLRCDRSAGARESHAVSVEKTGDKR